MQINCACISVALVVSLGAAGNATGEQLVHRSFNQLFAGDDPGELFTFELTFNPLVPSVVQFDGYFDNQAIDDTGVRFALAWRKPDGSGGSSPEQGFMPLPSFGRLPITFEQPIDFTPSTIVLHIEGGGPGDYFRFICDFTIDQVPEPGVSMLLGTAAILVSLGRRSRL